MVSSKNSLVHKSKYCQTVYFGWKIGVGIFPDEKYHSIKVIYLENNTQCKYACQKSLDCYVSDKTHRWGFHPSFETQGRRHQKSNTGVPVAPQKWLVTYSNYFKKNNAHRKNSWQHSRYIGVSVKKKLLLMPSLSITLLIRRRLALCPFCVHGISYSKSARLPSVTAVC